MSVVVSRTKFLRTTRPGIRGETATALPYGRPADWGSLSAQDAGRIGFLWTTGPARERSAGRTSRRQAAHGDGPAKLIWRGIFLSFAFGMILAAFDPLGRHRSFLVLLVLSGYLPFGEMAADNVLSAAMGGMNGNPEHLYGVRLGWFVIASISLFFLILNRGKGT